MALSPIISGGADLASAGGYGASPLTSEPRAQAIGQTQPAPDPTLADPSRRIISDPVSLSAQALKVGEKDGTRSAEPSTNPGAAKSASGDALTEGEQKQVAELKKRDR